MYFTSYPEYALKYSSKEQPVLVLNYIVFSNPYPLVGDDGLNFKGKGNYRSFNSHYVLVSPTSNDPNTLEYLPAKSGLLFACFAANLHLVNNAMYDEIVV